MFLRWTFFSALICLVLTVDGCCRQMESKPNQQSPSTSPSGLYVLRVPVVAVEDSRGKTLHFWMPEIADSSGKLPYKDNEGFPARFNVYWCWDSEDRVWLYNSDDGKVWFWEQPQRIAPKASHSFGDPDEANWTRNYWGYGKKNECGLDISPPASLYPDYVK